MVHKKYGALRTIAIYLKIVAILALFIGLIVGFVMIVKAIPPSEQGDYQNNFVEYYKFISGIITIIGSIISSIITFALAEIIMVFIDTEENTRILIKIMDKDKIAEKSYDAEETVDAPSDKFLRCPKCKYDNPKDCTNCTICGTPL